MKKFFQFLLAATIVVCPIVHRNAIKAAVNKEPLPEAPKWHVWLPESMRKTI